MVKATSLGVGLAAVCASSALHAAVLLVRVGHAGEPPTAIDQSLIEVSLDAADPPEIPTPEPRAPARSQRELIWPTHTHPYPVPIDHDAIPHDPKVVHPRTVPTSDSVPRVEAAPSVQAADDAPTFALTVAAAAFAHGGLSEASSALEPANGATDAALSERQVDARARLLEGPPPSYPEAARAAGAEGNVGLELVVGPRGNVEEARVVHAAGHGLDEAALRAARRFRFAPAINGGRAVRVRMEWSVQFRVR